MAETYPSSFLPAVTAGLGTQVKPSVIRTNFDGGKTRQRMRFETRPEIFNANWEMTDAQFEIFEAWVRTKLNRGNDWFNIDLPAGKQGFTTVLARFVGGRYSRTHFGVFDWKVSAQLEIEDEYGLTETELDAILTP